MGVRAQTIIVCSDWESHVGFVVWHVEIDAIPAGREEDLLSEAVRAVVVGEATCLGFGRATIIEAVEGDGLRWEVGTTRALERVTRDHAEARWERLETSAGTAIALQIVDSSTTYLIDTLECAILSCVVECWDPVVAVVSDYCAGGAGGCLGRVVVHRKVEAIASHNGVNMARHRSR